MDSVKPIVFVSYSRVDAQFAAKLRDKLIDFGYEVWIDVESIPSGANWDDAIDAGLKQCDVILGVMSPESVNSENVKNEWAAAKTFGKPLLLIMLRDCQIPHRYVRKNYIDFRQQQDFALVHNAIASGADPDPEKDESEPSQILPVASSTPGLHGRPLVSLPAAVRQRGSKRKQAAGISLVLLFVALAVVFYRLLSFTPASPCPEGSNPIPEGEFWMGAVPGDSEAKPDEFAANQKGKVVSLKAFCMDRTEVSNKQYEKFIHDTQFLPPNRWYWKYYPQGIDDLPVVSIAWYDARNYCAAQGGRLPTEAEWEKAARGSDILDPQIYPWKGGWDTAKAKSNAVSTQAYPVPVNFYPEGQSPYGILNMAGNVAEWVADAYQSDWYSQMPFDNPTLAPTSVYDKLVVRGGSFLAGAADLRVSARLGTIPPNMPPSSLESINFIGFRCSYDLKSSNQMN